MDHQQTEYIDTEVYRREYLVQDYEGVFMYFYVYSSAPLSYVKVENGTWTLDEAQTRLLDAQIKSFLGRKEIVNYVGGGSVERLLEREIFTSIGKSLKVFAVNIGYQYPDQTMPYQFNPLIRLHMKVIRQLQLKIEQDVTTEIHHFIVTLERKINDSSMKSLYNELVNSLQNVDGLSKVDFTHEIREKLGHLYLDVCRPQLIYVTDGNPDMYRIWHADQSYGGPRYFLNKQNATGNQIEVFDS